MRGIAIVGCIATICLTLFSIAAALADARCPEGPTDIKSLLGRRMPVHLGSQPVRINPDGACEITWWFRHCVYVRQARRDEYVGALLPGGRGTNEGCRYHGTGLFIPA
jgi:hypothetical protein